MAENGQPVMSEQSIRAAAVEFRRHRWYVVIALTLPNGEVAEFVADAQLQGGDGVWFGPRAEWDEAMEDR
jgi:hypothetical protein